MKKEYPIIDRWNKERLATLDEIITFIDDYIEGIRFTQENILDFYPDAFRRKVQFTHKVLLELGLIPNERTKHLSSYYFLKQALVRPAQLFAMYMTLHRDAFRRYQLASYDEGSGNFPSYQHCVKFITQYKNEVVCLKPFYELVQSTCNHRHVFTFLDQFIQGDLRINVRSI